MKPKIVQAKQADSYTNGVDPVDNMTPEEIKDMCHWLCKLSWSDHCEETLIGCIIQTFKEWRCDLHIKPFRDPMNAYEVKLVFWPTEFKIVAPSLEKAFVKTGHVLGKWKLGPIEPPKPTSDKKIIEFNDPYLLELVRIGFQHQPDVKGTIEPTDDERVFRISRTLHSGERKVEYVRIPATTKDSTQTT